jgi:hypothetical protein
MRKSILLCTLTALAPAAAWAQPIAAPALPGGAIRLDVVASGEVTRAPDMVTISAGVVTRAPQAEAALRDNATRMERVRAALRTAGIQPRDIQTGSISLSQDYERQEGGRAPSGFVASNQLNIRFRDIANAGRVIDALVAQGVNNVNGPMLSVENREAALDEARTRAVAVARRRAELYARALGSRVVRIVSVSEAGPSGIVIGESAGRLQASDAATQVEPGEQVIGTSLTVTFELGQPTR